MIHELEKKVQDFCTNTYPKLEVVAINSSKVAAACKLVDKSWSQSTLGSHATLYFRNFEEPNLRNRFNIEWGLSRGMPAGWHDRSEDQVKSKIHEISGLDISLDAYIDQCKEAEKLIEDFQQDILSNLETITVPTELNLNYKKISEFKLGSWASQINSYLRGNIMTRDREAVSSGKRIPSHLSLLAHSQHFSNVLIKTKDLIKTITRLIQQLETKNLGDSNQNHSDSRVQILEELVSTLIKSHEDLKNTVDKLSVPIRRKDFFATTKIQELDTLQLHHYQYDLSKLIQLCKEMNSAYESENYLSCAMIGRTILNHIPPIFNCPNFDTVANNRGSSQKQSFLKLSTSLKAIADNHLHHQIRVAESLPSEQQIDFIPEFDVLLSEIIVEIKKSQQSIQPPAQSSTP